MRHPDLRIALLADAAHVNTQRWCEGLSRAGAEIHLLSFSACSPKGVQNLHLPIPKLLGKVHYFVAVPYVRQLIHRIQPDVLLAYSVTGYGTLGALSASRPLVQVTAGSDVLLAPRNPLMQRLVRYNLSRADLVTAWAPHMADAASWLGVDDERMLVLPRGIPVREFAGVRCSRPVRNDVGRIISTRTLKPDYNVELLLRMMSILETNGIAFSLTLAGDGPDRKKLVALTRELGLENRVRFPGFVPNDQLPRLLAEHNLYLSLVDSDGVSASLLEAMVVGLLPIVPNHAANRPWIQSGQNGVLLDDLSPANVANAIAMAISNLPLRRKAWQQNAEIVRNHADLYYNAELFVERFRQLASYHRGSIGRPLVDSSPFA
jgi:glycosyltransferase involved in cell wall biosynthesis